MNKCRKIYGVILVFTLAGLFISGSRYMLIVLAAEIALLLVLKLLLLIDAGGIEVTQQMRPACTVGQEVKIEIGIKNRRVFLAAGFIEITIEYRNILFGTKTQYQALIPLRDTREAFTLPVTPKLCGEVHVRWKKVICRDIFGLCQTELKTLREKMFTVYPGIVPIHIFLKRQIKGSLEGEQYYQSRKGNDVSEIFELREYHPGDDIRSIHWKLSGKMDSMIVREGSDASHYDTILLFDAGLRQKDVQWNESMLSQTVEFAASVSQKMLELGIPHYVAIPSGGGLECFSVSERADYTRMIDMWMGITLPDQEGTALKHFIIEKMQYAYTKMVYITAGAYPEELYTIMGNIGMTAICVKEEGEEVALSDRGTSQMIELPYNMVKSHPRNIFI